MKYSNEAVLPNIKNHFWNSTVCTGVIKNPFHFLSVCVPLQNISQHFLLKQNSFISVQAATKFYLEVRSPFSILSPVFAQTRQLACYKCNYMLRIW